MKKWQLTLIIVFSIISQVDYAQESLIGNKNFTLYWSDEFDILDLGKWSVSDRLNDYNPDLAPTYFTSRPENVRVENGYLQLKVNIENYNGASYTGGEIQSIQAFAPDMFFESRLKLPISNHSAPAFWVYSGTGDCSVPNYREADFLEWFGRVEKTSADVHYCVCQKILPTDNCRGHDAFSYSLDVNPFHLFTGRISSNKVYFYHNNFNVRQTDRYTNYFDAGVYINFWSLMHTWNGDNLTMDFQNYPSIFYIDYIRLFSLKKDCETIVSIIPSFNTFNYSVKKLFNLSNTTVIPSNENISLLAKDYIELNNGFIIPNNTNIEFGTIDCE